MHMILFFYGADTFRSRRHLEQSIEKFKRERDPQGYNCVRIDGKDAEAGKILTELVSAPFLSTKRMVVVENVLSNTDQDVLIAMGQGLTKVPESTIAVFWQCAAVGKSKEAKKLLEQLKKEKYAQEFEPLGAKLGAWVQKEITDRGATIEPSALQYIVDNAGQDLWLVGGLIDQLSAYATGRKITVADVQLFLDQKIDDNIFSLTDAMVNGRRKYALTLLYEQRRLGEEDMKLAASIGWQFRVLLNMSDLFDREPNATSDMVAAKLGIHPFVAKKNMAQAKKFGTSKLKAIAEELLAVDIKTKTGQADQATLLDLLVNKL